MAIVQMLAAALLLALIALVYFGWLAQACRCTRCSFHVSEAEAAKARQKELQHEAEHRGFGWRDNSPDIFSCHNENCPRNPQRRD